MTFTARDLPGPHLSYCPPEITAVESERTVTSLKDCRIAIIHLSHSRLQVPPHRMLSSMVQVTQIPN
jgi:putative heme iron utilization protein